MHRCEICGHPCKTVQGLRGHTQLRHPEANGSGAGATDDDNVVLSLGPDGAEVPGAPDPAGGGGPVLSPGYIQALEGLSDVPDTLAQLQERLAHLEALVGENSDLQALLEDTHATLNTVLERLDNGNRLEDEGDPEEEEPAAVADPKPENRGWWDRVCQFVDEGVEERERALYPELYP